MTASHSTHDLSLADCCSAFASTRPPTRPQTRRWHGAADSLLSASRPVLVPLMIGLGVTASLTAGALPVRLAMMVLAAFFLVAGGWCDLNFVRSREAHCIVTGIGWTALAALGLAAAVAGANWNDALWLAFFAILIAGAALELTWAARSGSTAL